MLWLLTFSPSQLVEFWSPVFSFKQWSELHAKQLLVRMSESTKCSCFLFQPTFPWQHGPPHAVPACRHCVHRMSFKDVNTRLCGTHISMSHPLTRDSGNTETNSGSTDLSGFVIFFFFSKAGFYWLHIASMGWVWVVKVCFELTPVIVSLTFRNIRKEKRDCWFSVVIWCAHFTLVFQKSQGLLLDVFLLLGSREYAHGECQWWFCWGRNGEKGECFGHCMLVCSVLSKKVKKGHRCCFTWFSAHSLNFKTEDYIG